MKEKKEGREGDRHYQEGPEINKKKISAKKNPRMLILYHPCQKWT
jgi:hypothetical protein